MEKILKNLMLMVAIAMSIVSCTKVDVDTPTIETAGGTTLTAIAPGAAETKISFSEGGTTDDDGVYTSAIDLTWDDGTEDPDTFTVYDASGDIVGDFTCTNAGAGTFTSTTANLTDGKTYTAVYPASTESTLVEAQARDLTSEQNGDEISSLNNACMMEVEFEYSSSSSNTIAFEHLKAVMTFTFEIESGREFYPTKLVFDNGDGESDLTYVVNFEDSLSNGYYTSYIMIEPCTDTTRTLTFSLFDGDTAYDVRTVESSVAYVAGYRYTSPVSTLPIDIVYNDGIYEIYTDMGLLAFANIVNGQGNPGANWIDNTATKSTDSNNTNFAFDYINSSMVSHEAAKINGKLMNDIDLSDICNETDGTSWLPIGTPAGGLGSLVYYGGTFDGNGHKVTGLYIKEDLAQRGLFGFISEDAVIRNLGVAGEVIVNSNNSSLFEAAGIVAFNYGTVINCYNLVNVSGYANIGGVVGHNDGYVINCYNQGEISGTKNVGGVVGQMGEKDTTATYTNDGNIGYMTACYNIGKAEGTSHVGGVLGWLNTEGENALTSCYCIDNVTYSIGSTSQTANIMTSDNMKKDDFVTTLNTATAKYNAYEGVTAKACAWVTGDDGYPTFDFSGTPTYTVTVSCIDYPISGETNSYELREADQLIDLATKVNAGETYSGYTFKMTNDIDLNHITFAGIGIILYQFQGTFDGGGFEVQNLVMNENSNSKLGFFGYVGDSGVVCNLNLGANGKIIGTSTQWEIGGIVSYNYGTIINCHNLATVNGGYNVGGIAAYNEGNIVNCYNLGTIYGYANNTGGICGQNKGSITACYNAYYSNENITGSSQVGEIVGYNNSGTVSYCYYIDGNTAIGTGTSGVSIDGESTIVGWSTTDMGGQSFVTTLNIAAYNYNAENTTSYQACAWKIDSSSDSYPYPTLDFYEEVTSYIASGSGTDGDPYLIEDADQLIALSTRVENGATYSGVYFELKNDINLSDSVFSSIGFYDEGDDGNHVSFQGTFNGGGHMITLSISKSNSNCQGLFGYIKGATIENLGVKGSVAGKKYVGGIVGFSSDDSKISNCYSNVTVDASSGYAGGIIGHATSATISCCYSRGTVTGGSDIGGVVGEKGDKSTITYCYYDSTLADSIGAVNGANDGTNYCGLTTTEMTDGTLLNYLNTSGENWKAGSSDYYPILK
ncbi:MAG: GLUG motif-containing protein [Rikenellaceae bacterium]